MHFSKKIITLSLFPLVFSCAIFNTSCNKEICIETTFKNHAIAPGWDDPVLTLPLDEFKKSFSFGDIIELDIDAKNGQKYTVTLPYIKEFTEAGYYAPCIADYPDSNEGDVLSVDISLALWPSGRNISTDIFFGQPVKVKMKEKGGYLDPMNLANCGQKLTYDETGSSPACFANFRDISEVGNINKFINKGMLFRGSAPFDADSTNRYSYVNSLMEANNVQYDICLSKDIESKGKYPLFDKISEEKSPKATYIRKLYGDTKENPQSVSAFNFGTDYFTENALKMVKNVLTVLAKDGINSFYIHCNEGKDRTGFFLMLLEAFATPDPLLGTAVTVDDIIADFMLSYKNYFNITLADNISRYQQLIELTIYRHLYSIMLDNPTTDVGKIDWFDKSFDVRVEVTKKLKEHNLWYYASNYIRNVVKLEEEHVKKIQNKFYIYGEKIK